MQPYLKSKVNKNLDDPRGKEKKKLLIMSNREENATKLGMAGGPCTQKERRATGFEKDCQAGELMKGGGERVGLLKTKKESQGRERVMTQQGQGSPKPPKTRTKNTPKKTTQTNTTKKTPKPRTHQNPPTKTQKPQQTQTKKKHKKKKNHCETGLT